MVDSCAFPETDSVHGFLFNYGFNYGFLFQLFFYRAQLVHRNVSVKQFCEAPPILVESSLCDTVMNICKIFKQQTYCRGLYELNLRGGGCDPRKSLFKSLF